MKSLLVVLVLLAIIVATESIKDRKPFIKFDVEKEWIEFLKLTKKEYIKNIETTKRKHIFATNIEAINKHNDLFDQKKKTYDMKWTEEDDLTDAEWLSRRIPLPNEPEIGGAVVNTTRSDVIPPKVDWSTGQNVLVTPVKDQGTCGSCYIFTAVGVLEGFYTRKTGRLVELSEKYFLDCLARRFGCNGGNPFKVLEYAKNNCFVEKSAYSPYNGKKETCQEPKEENCLKLREFKAYKNFNENFLMKIVSQHGPVAVDINSRLRSFSRYNSGIYSESNCSKEPTHSVLLVGYGTEKRGDYWLIKNSIGKEFGMKGYLKLKRGDNMCGIVTRAVVYIDSSTSL